MNSKGLQLYKASAGSGKTYSVVLEIIKILTSEVQKYQNVLAITFTNKAADEMKSRTLQELFILKTEPKKSHYYKELKKQFSEAEIDNSINDAFRNILRDFDRFSISTIDSFFQKLSRSFSRELDLPYNYEISIESNDITKESVELLYSESTNSETFVSLQEFMEEKFQDGKSFDIAPDLKKFAEEFFQSHTSEKLKSLENSQVNYSEIKNVFRKELSEIRKPLIRKAKAALKIIEEAGLKKEDFSRGTIITNLREIESGKIELRAVFLKKAESGEFGTAKTKEKIVAQLGNNHKKLQNLLLEIVEIWEEKEQDFNDLQLLNEKIYVYTLLEKIAINIENEKTSKNLILLSDISQKLNELVKLEEAPFIYFKFGQRFKHIFLDEFQDTSKEQWISLKPFVVNAINSETQNDEANLSMIVGDVKQAIYKFRGGDSEIMANLENEFEFQDKIILYQTENKNYRSSGQIVEFNNNFFQRIRDEIFSEDEQIKTVYANVKQNIHHKNMPGFVKMHFAKKIGNSNKEYHEASLEMLIKDITKANENGWEYKDMAILVRSKTNLDKITELLEKNEIEYVSAVSMKLDQNSIVQFFITFFKFTIQTSDTFSLTQAIIAFSKLLSDEAQKAIHSDLSKIFSENQQSFAIKKALELLSPQFTLEKIRSFRGFPAEKFARFIVAELDLYNLAKENIAFLDEFLNILNENTIKFSTIELFLEWWEIFSEKQAVEIPESLQAIRILTIHASKGLEFPIVFLPFSDWNFFKGEDEWYKTPENLREKYNLPEYVLLNEKGTKKIEKSSFSVQLDEHKLASRLDGINQLYVAFTRAENQLYIYTHTSKTENINNVAQLLNKYADLVNIETLEDKAETWGSFFSKPELGQNDDAEDSDEKLKVRHIENFVSGKLPEMKYKEFGKILYSEAISAQKFGDIVHEILQKYDSSRKITEILDLARKKHGISDQVFKEIEFEIKNVLEKPDINSLFTKFPKFWNEKSILDESGEIFRIDRLILDKNQFIILEIKTGEQNSEYEKQVENYRRIIKKAGLSVKKTIILYTKTAELVEI